MITFLGDVALLTGDFSSDYKITENPYVINLEYVTGKNRYTPVDGKINLYSPNCNLENVFGQNPKAAVIANNHTFDFGEQGFSQTLKTLQEKGICTVGDKMCWISPDVCLLAYSLVGGAQECAFRKDRVLADINEARKKGAKKIIVNVHWGIENHPNMNKTQREIGHWLIDNDVDFVIGHHPHCIQPIELYCGRYICYSLGNCVFSNFSVKSHYSEGKPTRTYRFKWQWWNRKSIAVNYDESTGEITIDELYTKKSNLICKRYNAELKRYQGIRCKLFADIIYKFRKYYLFFSSNSLVDGKLFDFSAIKAEVVKK